MVKIGILLLKENAYLVYSGCVLTQTANMGLVVEVEIRVKDIPSLKECF